jgi:hypothetical protein
MASIDGRRVVHRILVANMRERDYLENSGIDGRIILNNRKRNCSRTQQ